MAIQESEELIKRATVIRNEKADYANTAERVGGLLVDMIESFLKNVADNPELLNKYIRKDCPDGTKFRFEVGEFIDSMLAGKGTGIFPDGRIQTDRIEVRGAAIFKELIFNRWKGEEGNSIYSETGIIDKVTQRPDGLYDLVLRKRWDADITAFDENDVVFGSVNNLLSTGEYFDSWFRVVAVQPMVNQMTVRLYPNDEVPGGTNNPPQVGMSVARRGNPVNTRRQGYWYISSTEGCICMLDGVTKPILDTTNYSVIIGKLPEIPLFKNLPIDYEQSYVYCRGIATQDIMRINYQGKVVRKENFRGFWSLAVAQSDEPYESTREFVDTVSHVGCEYMCLKSNTIEEPKFGAQDWAMLRGNPIFEIFIDSTEGWNFDFDQVAQKDQAGQWIPFTTLVVTGQLYNQDVTSFIKAEDVRWQRDTGDKAEDDAWATSHKGIGLNLPLTAADLGTDYRKRSSCKYICTALIRDGKQAEIAEEFVTF